VSHRQKKNNALTGKILAEPLGNNGGENNGEGAPDLGQEVRSYHFWGEKEENESRGGRGESERQEER